MNNKNLLGVKRTEWCTIVILYWFFFRFYDFSVNTSTADRMIPLASSIWCLKAFGWSRRIWSAMPYPIQFLDSVSFQGKDRIVVLYWDSALNFSSKTLNTLDSYRVCPEESRSIPGISEICLYKYSITLVSVIKDTSLTLHPFHIWRLVKSGRMRDKCLGLYCLKAESSPAFHLYLKWSSDIYVSSRYHLRGIRLTSSGQGSSPFLRARSLE